MISPDLDMAMVAEGWRSPTKSDEAGRFTLHMKRLLAPVERRFGDSYFNAVLVRFVRESGFSEDERIRDLLQVIHANGVDDQGESFRYCTEMIRTAIAKLARISTDQLGYSQEEAETILCSAIASYLDERFSISAGRNLGLYASG